jgi:hypothetical protein
MRADSLAVSQRVSLDRLMKQPSGEQRRVAAQAKLREKSNQLWKTMIEVTAIEHEDHFKLLDGHTRGTIKWLQAECNSLAIQNDSTDRHKEVTQFTEIAETGELPGPPLTTF